MAIIEYVKLAAAFFFQSVALVLLLSHLQNG